METEVKDYPTLPREDLIKTLGDFLIDVDVRPPPNKETNIMTQDELDHLRESCYFPAGVQTRLSEASKTIMLALPSELALYKVVFQAGLRFPIHPTLRKILAFYNVCLTLLAPNARQSTVCALVLWRYKKYALFSK